MSARILTGELGHDITLIGEGNPRHATVISVLAEGQRRSVMVIGNRVSSIDFDQYLDVVQIENRETATRWFARLSPVGRWISGIALALASAAVVAALLGVLQIRVVLTGSMLPTIAPGDVIVALAPQYKAPVEGDVVLYKAERFDGTEVSTFAHRIIGGNATQGFLVQGDANEQADVQRPTINEIYGVELFAIPKLGLLLSTQNLLLIAMTVLALWLLLNSGFSRVERD